MQLLLANAGNSGIERKPAIITHSNLVFIMRASFFTALFFLLGLQLLLAKNTIGQSAGETYITLELHKVSLATAFKKIEKMTDYLFAYQPQQVRQYDGISLPKATRSVSATLEMLLKNTGLSFKQSANSIIIFKTGDKMEVALSSENLVAAQAADTAIAGVVTNAENGQPLENVSVRLKGRNAGTSTNSKGEFRLKVNSLSGTLVFSSVGFEEQELKLAGRNSFSVGLKISNIRLDDVVVIGYGTKKKRDVTGTVSSLSNDEIVKSRATNAQEAMQGRVSGVDVKRNSGRPGADYSIEIRGANSISGNTQPLYVVDGIPGSNINDINPADIERIDILKDASSTAIYGSRGANGVVIISTKKGLSGGSKVTYEGNVGFVQGYNMPKMMDGPEFVAYAREFYNTQALNNGQATPVADNKIFSPTELANIANGTYTNWLDLIKQNGLQTNHLVTLSGGDGKSNYFLSAGYQQYEGATKVANLKKYTLKVGLDKTINNKLKFGATTYLTFYDNNPGSAEVFRSAHRLRPTGSAYNTDGSNRFFAFETEGQITNPLFEFDNSLQSTKYIKMMPNVYGEWNILRGLKFRSSFTADITYQRGGTYNDTYTKSGAGVKANAGQYNTNHWTNYALDNFLTYTKQINANHKFDVVAGNSVNYYQNDYSFVTVTGLPYRSLWFNVGSATAATINGVTLQPTTSVGSGYSKNTWISYLARVNYSFKNRYLLTVTGRYDGASVLAEGNQWNFFPSVGLAWVASEESFIKNIAAINLLKLRFSYGKAGNAGISPYISQVNVNQTLYDFNGSAANGYAPNGLGNKNLTWEISKEYNAGLEINILKNRVALQFDYYNKTMKGSILTQQIPAANMFSQVIANIGSIRNSGIEIGLNTTNIKAGKFSWTSAINYSKNKNAILDLYGNKKSDPGNSWFIGEKARVIYNYKVIGVWQTPEADEALLFNQKPGQWKIQDTDGDKKITSADRVIVGSNIPNWFGGITNSFNYSNVDISVTVYTRQGVTEFNQFYGGAVDGDQNRARFNGLSRSYWTPTNPTNEFANNAIETDGTRKNVSEYKNASYTKISNITLGFNIPKKALERAKINSLRLYLTAYNPFIFTSYIGWDPETASADTFGSQDFRTRTFLFGVNISL